ncbi:VOC family protein [Blastomonas sp. CCH5-E3]|uniref:VOC family protein n=1 Tax=Blastomonas sp. CCH5-E3 TaxID=1768750 RepID=UPI001E3272EF|nr:VOC family protein [Blastomonas sp. CCH5-E3]
MTDAPAFLAADHVSFTVPDLEAAIAFYADTFGARELFRMGPLAAGGWRRMSGSRAPR